MQKVLIFEKKICFHQLDSNLRPPESSHMAVVFDGMFSPLLLRQPTAEHNLITAFTCSDKLGGYYSVDWTAGLEYWTGIPDSYIFGFYTF